MTAGYIDLFQADNPQGNKPHFKGFVKIDGVKYEFACWPAKSGKPGVYSGTLKPEGERNPPAQPPQPEPPRRVNPLDDDSEIPF